MSENLQKFTLGAHTLRSVASRVPADAWDNPSCCEGWTAREVAGHASWVLQAVAAGAGAGEPPAPQPEAEVAGDDPAATVRAAVDRCLAALDQPGVINAVGPTPFGEMPLDSMLGILWVDPLTHGWDIADAAGIDSGIDDDTARMAHQQIASMGDVLRASGRFGPEAEATGQSALDAFIAFSGRTSVNAG